MPKISFIVPVYNMEKYLERALKSVQNQTLDDFEVVLVDDGSKDNSGKICDEFAAKDDRFHVIHKPNGGVASARNTALDAAVGDYLFFLDPDDWIEPNAAQVLIDEAEKNDAELVMFGLFNDTYDGKNNLIFSRVETPDFSGVFRDDPCKRLFDKIATSHLIIVKLMRRSFVEENHCRFKNYSLGEDGIFFADVYRNNPQCLVVLDTPLYHYTNSRSNSLSNSFHPERIEQGFILSANAYEIVKDWGLLDSPLHANELDYCTIRDMQMCIKNLGFSPENNSKCANIISEFMKDKRISDAVKRTKLKSINSLHDRIKLFLLKIGFYRTLVFISKLNRAI